MYETKDGIVQRAVNGGGQAMTQRDVILATLCPLDKTDIAPTSKQTKKTKQTLHATRSLETAI